MLVEVFICVCVRVCVSGLVDRIGGGYNIVISSSSRSFAI